MSELPKITGPGQITKPGMYDVPIELYHGKEEICDSDSVSSSGLRTIKDDCPARYKYNRDNPKPPSGALVMGSAAHEWLLEGDQWSERHRVLPEDWNARTKAGKELKEKYEAQGYRVLRFEQFEAVKAMRQAIEDHDWLSAAFTNGTVEPTIAWKDPEFGIWLRCRPDFLPKALRFIPDFKTSRSARPENFAKSIKDYGYHMQAALYMDGIKAVTGEMPKSFMFVVQEKEAPYLTSVLPLAPDAIEWGRLANRKAMDIFVQCMESGKWPGYADEPVSIDLPGWFAAQLQTEHEAGAFLTSRDRSAAA